MPQRVNTYSATVLTDTIQQIEKSTKCDQQKLQAITYITFAETSGKSILHNLKNIIVVRIFPVYKSNAQQISRV